MWAVRVCFNKRLFTNLHTQMLLIFRRLPFCWCNIFFKSFKLKSELCIVILDVNYWDNFALCLFINRRRIPVYYCLIPCRQYLTVMREPKYAETFQLTQVITRLTLGIASTRLVCLIMIWYLLHTYSVNIHLLNNVTSIAIIF